MSCFLRRLGPPVLLGMAVLHGVIAYGADERTAGSSRLPFRAIGTSVFEPTSDVTFDTNSGGRLVTIMVDGAEECYRVFDFLSIHVPEGVTVRAVGDLPLVLVATGNVLIEGTIDVSATAGLPGENGGLETSEGALL